MNRQIRESAPIILATVCDRCNQTTLTERRYKFDSRWHFCAHWFIGLKL